MNLDVCSQLLLQMMPLAISPGSAAADSGRQGAAAPNSALAAAAKVNPDGSLVSPAAFVTAIKSDAATMAQLRATNPEVREEPGLT